MVPSGWRVVGNYGSKSLSDPRLRVAPQLLNPTLASPRLLSRRLWQLPALSYLLFDEKYTKMSAPGAGHEFPAQEVSWQKRDVLLFANSIGCKADELQFLFVGPLDQQFPVMFSNGPNRSYILTSRSFPPTLSFSVCSESHGIQVNTNSNLIMQPSSSPTGR